MEGMKEFPDKFWDLAIVDPPYGSADAINPISSVNKYAAKRSIYAEFELIERATPHLINKLELFAREESEGWDVYGNEVNNSIQLTA